MGGKIFFEEVQLWDEIPTLTKDPVTETQLVKYSGASGDFNPIHTVHRIGEEAGFGGVIAHGLLIMGFIGQAVTTWIPNHYLRGLRVRFMGVTRPKDVITITGRIIQKIPDEKRIRCEVEAKDQAGEVKIRGSFDAILPSKPHEIDE